MADEIKLPHPATSSEMFTHAAVLELRKLNDNIERLINLFQGIAQPEQVASTEPQEVALREPEPKKPRHRDDAKKAAAAVATDAVGPVTVETVEIVPPSSEEGAKDGSDPIQ